ncbi:hypothetical protein LIER_10419 [Lithospermum erythrorhizon]|uniref:Uncharacterized protein n=1 Tax=Lithospermum erythrorhizon TaxID=34254 RepID=A0AAV3PKH9_LITER
MVVALGWSMLLPSGGPQVVEEKAQKLKGQKKSKRGKGEGLKAPASTKKKDLSEHHVVPGAADSMGSVNVLSVDDTVTDASKQPSAENLDEAVDPSVKNTMNELKENAPTGGVENRPTVIDTGNDTENVTLSVGDTFMEEDTCMESMDILSAAGIDGLSDGREVVIPSAADTGAGDDDLPGEGAEPTVGEGVADTLNAKEMEIPENVGQEKTKSKKRKHKKGGDESEAFEPKKKMSNEERAAKRARRAERKARKGTEKAAEDDAQEVADEQVPPVEFLTNGFLNKKKKKIMLKRLSRGLMRKTWLP